MTSTMILSDFFLAFSYIDSVLLSAVIFRMSCVFLCAGEALVFGGLRRNDRAK